MPASPHPCWARPIPPLAVAYMAGILAGSRFADAWAAFLASCLLSFFFLIRCVAKHGSARFSPIVLMLSLGGLSMHPLLSSSVPENHVAHLIDRRVEHLEAKIVSEPRAGPGRLRFVAAVSPGKEPGPAAEGPTGRVRVTVIGKPADLNRGDRIRFAAKLRAFRNFENPGGFDYRRYMALNGVRVSAYVGPGDLQLMQKAAAGPVETARRRLAGFLAERIDPPAEGILRALLIGDRNGISPAVREAFNRAGVGHVLAISGLHMGIVAGVSFFLFRWLCAWVPPVLRRGWTRKTAAVLSLAAVVGYGLLAGMSPSTQRAVIMVASFMAAVVFGRLSDPINALAAAAVAVLVLDPGALFSISFQLSFAAVAAILYGMKAARRWGVLEAFSGRFSRRILIFCLVSVLAIAGTLPVTAYYFNQVSLVGFAANFLAIPLIGFVVVPLGLASAALLAAVPALAEAGFEAAAWVLGLAVEGIALFAGLPHAAVRVVTPSLLELAVFYVLFWALLHLHLGRPARIAAAAALLVAGADVCHWVQHRFWHPELRVTAIDVGQGSAALLELPRGNTMLVDGGGFSDNRLFDVGAQVVAPFLWRQKIAVVDTVVLSHPNSDHLNGLVFIVDNFEVKEFVANGQPADTEAYRQLMTALAKRKVARPAFDLVRRDRMVNGVRIEILHPGPGFLSGQSKAGSQPDANDNSIVVRAGLGAVSFLFPGDVMSGAESHLADAACPGLRATIMAAPHHGSRTSSTPAFLDCVRPELVIVSSGWSRRRYFPHSEVRQRYQERGLQVLCTHRRGAVTVITDGNGYRVETAVGAE